MIVWLASFPRSGNTFFRILLRHLHGAPTYSGFNSGDDLSLVGAEDLTGHGELPPALKKALQEGDRAALQPYHDSNQVFFIKSHMTADETRVNDLPTVLLVRDVRDTLVSFSWYHLQVRTFQVRSEPLLSQLRSPRRHAQALRLRFFALLADLGLRDRFFRARLAYLVENPRWSRLNASWLDRPGGPLAVVRFEDLVARPQETLRTALQEIGYTGASTGSGYPSFEELRRVYPAFFREGKVGTGKAHFSSDLQERLREVHGEVMQRLNYTI